MMLKQKLAFLFFYFPFLLSAQVNDTISEVNVSRIMGFLASDSLNGRGNYTAELHKAAYFIVNEFNKDSLLPFQGSFLQPFTTHTLSKKESLADTLGQYEPEKVLLNVIAVLEGRSLAEEAIIISAHFDHMGGNGPNKDRIYNGANDNASGITALLTLAHYFAMRNDNERTLIFCAFSGEELGLYGSSYFAEKIDAKSIIAVINIEMIGRNDVCGRNAFYLTGSHFSNLYKILNDNLKHQKVRIVKERNQDLRLFYRSDNLPFALKGIPAHTIMCSDDSDPCYHMPCDEIKRIDTKNMTEVIRAIPIALRSIINGKDTPTRVDPERVR